MALLNEYGATLCTPDREATPLDLPEADEIVLSPDGVMYACWFENESFRVQAYRFEAEAFKPAGQPCVVNVHSLHGEDLVVLGIPWRCRAVAGTRVLCLAARIAGILRCIRRSYISCSASSLCRVTPSQGAKIPRADARLGH